MGTRGDITVVSEGHYYSHYQHTDMFPSGHIQALLREAADITQCGEWDDVADGWIQKAWLVPEDDALPKKLQNTVRHPDGDDYKRFDWSDGMRPRLTHADLVDRGFQEVQRHLGDLGPAKLEGRRRYARHAQGAIRLGLVEGIRRGCRPR